MLGKLEGLHYLLDMSQRRLETFCNNKNVLVKITISTNSSILHA